ncbi:MAG: hypothetical protein KDJ26_08955 [Alphaproteobacteria bacterium]|nr:hypothetical protein [Alphaproteobacteria bacterium]
MGPFHPLLKRLASTGMMSLLGLCPGGGSGSAVFTVLLDVQAAAKDCRAVLQCG